MGHDAVHILAGGAWLGAMIPLLPILAAVARPEVREQASVALRRFSSAGHVAVTLVIATGAVNTGLVLGRWPTNWSSPYQALLALKIILVPRMRSRREPVLSALRTATLAEVGLGVAVLACVALFGLVEPS